MLGDLKQLHGDKASIEEKSRLVKDKTNKMLTVAVLQKIIHQANNDVPGNHAPFLNHLAQPNPYKSKYGEQWEGKISEVGDMKKM